MDSSDYAYRRKYQYLDINIKDETKMFKIAVPTFDFIFNTGIVNIQRYSLILSYERKISKPFSLYIDNFNVLDINGSYYKGYYTKLDWGIRYFYSMNKRIAPILH